MNTRIFTLLALCALTMPVMAFDTSGMYEVQVQQKGDDRNKALLAALDTMLLRLSANPNLLSDGRVNLLRRRVENYIQSYEYVNTGGSNDEPWLRVVFSRESLIAALSDLNIPSWGINRPRVLVWLVAGDAAGGHRLLRPGDRHQVLLELEKWSNIFGLPLEYPLLDLEDVSRMDSSQLWAGFDRNLRQASARYGNDAVVLLRVDGWQQGQWRLRWQLYLGDKQPLRWDDVTTGIESAVESGIGWLATELSLRFGLDNLDEQNINTFSITVSGVTSFAHMASVVSYLSEVHAIRNVQIQQARRGELHINLAATLDKAGVQNAIALSTLLIPVDIEQNSYRFNAEFN